MHVCVFSHCQGHDDKLDALLHGQQHLAAGQDSVTSALRTLISKVGKLMTASDDLKAAVTASDATVEGAITAITAIATYLQDIAGQISGGLSDEDAAALAADITEHATDLAAATANLVAADPGAPVVEPTEPTEGDGSTDGSGDAPTDGDAPTE